MNGEGTANLETALGRSIAKARRKAGLTQQQLCAKADLSYSTLAKIERGAIKTPSVFTVAAIAEATGTTIESLAGIETHKTKEPPQKAYKTSKSGIKFVYFDVNGVLVHYYQRAFTNIAIDTGVSADAVESIFWHYNDAVCRGEMSIEEFNSVLAKRVGIDNISWTDYYLNNIDVIDQSIELIKWAYDYYQIGLISNIMPGMIKAMINRGTIPDLSYSSVIDSSEIGMIKPESAIYERAQQTANVEPQEILLIDDGRANLMAAEKLGWHVIWFDDYRPDECIERIKKSLEF